MRRTEEMEFIAVPSGILIAGDDRIRDASPRHRAEMGAFGMGKFPVKNEDFARFLDAGGYGVESYWTKMGWRALAARAKSQPAYWNEPELNAPRQPVVGVTWYEAVAFCNWLTECAKSSDLGESFRLPTELEWEYAARGGESTRNFPWGNKFERGRANTAEMGYGRTTVVDHFSDGVSPFGVWDMSGNVFEWTLSKWGANWQELQFAYPYRAGDGREEVEGSGARVMRGGSWFNPYREALCAYRSRYLAGSRGSNIGFRVVRMTEERE